MAIYEKQLECQMAVTTASDSSQGFVWVMKPLGNYFNCCKENWQVFRGNLLQAPSPPDFQDNSLPIIRVAWLNGNTWMSLTANGLT